MRDAELLLRVRQAGTDGDAATGGDLVGKLERAGRARHLECAGDAALRELADPLGRVRIRGIHGGGGTQLAGHGQLPLVHVDRDDVLGIEHARGEQRCQADAAEPDDGCRRAMRHLRRVDDGTDAGDDGAAEQGSLGERQVGRHSHQGVRGEHRVLREAGHAQVVVHRAVAVVQPSLARQQRARGVRPEARLAQGRPTGRARDAVPAARHECRHYVITALEVRDARAELLDDAGGLVAEHHRHRPRTVAVDHGEV